MKISIVYSFFNEEENLVELINRTRSAVHLLGLDNNEYEIIFINDNSNDSSVKIILEEKRKKEDIKLINMSRNFGNAPCILAGFAFAKGEYIAYLDSDLQDPPELIEKMYKLAIEQGIDIVHTKRTQRLGESKVKMMITKIGYKILGATLSVKLQPNVGDFKLLSRRVVESVNEPLPFIRGMISYVGYKEVNLEYIRDARFGGETHYPVFGRRVISNFINNALIGYSDIPIYLIIYLSLFGIIFALCLLIYMLYIKFTNAAVPGSAGVIITVVTFSSFILFGIGILGLYLSSIKRAVLRRPQYFIDSVVD